jgi:protocatechuate 3,4-dioxygenase beta subunit
MMHLRQIRAISGRNLSAALTIATIAVGLSLLMAWAGSAGAADAPCPSTNLPNMLRIVAGSPQTTQLRKPFQTNLQVELANSNGCPLTGSLAGISVDFVAPLGGASGTFASTTTITAVVGTDSRGFASAPTFIANSIAGAYSVHANSDYGSVKLYLSNVATGVAASIGTSGSTDQSATVNAQFAQPLRAQVLDTNGQPIQGANVTFALGTGLYGAGANFLGGNNQASATTDVSGLATSPPLVANGAVGRYLATATTSDVAVVATFKLANHAATFKLTAGASQPETATVQTRYPHPLTARLLDAAGQPVEGATVTFTLPQAATGAGAAFPGGGPQATATTDMSGRATSPPLLANGTSGRFTATATTTATTTNLTYGLRNLAGKPTTITAGAAASTSTKSGSRFPIPLAVTVTDAKGNPVSGALVRFSAPVRGPTGRFRIKTTGMPHATRKTRIASVTSDGKGIAVAPPFIATLTPGGYIVKATIGHARTKAVFALVNQPAAQK